MITTDLKMMFFLSCSLFLSTSNAIFAYHANRPMRILLICRIRVVEKEDCVYRPLQLKSKELTFMRPLNSILYCFNPFDRDQKRGLKKEIEIQDEPYMAEQF